MPGTFWDFAVATHGRDCVEGVLHRLQDDLGADVDVLLWCLWLAARGQDVVPVISQAIAVSAAWQPTIKPLRQARRELKIVAESTAATERVPIVALRERIKACELDAERAEIERLGLLAGGSTGRPPKELVAANLHNYFAAMNFQQDLLGNGEVMRILTAAVAA